MDTVHVHPRVRVLGLPVYSPKPHIYTCVLDRPLHPTPRSRHEWSVLVKEVYIIIIMLLTVPTSRSTGNRVK